MLDFKGAAIEKIIVHKVGNRYQDEELLISKREINLADELLLDLLKKYFLKPFKEAAYYNFHHESSVELNDVYNYCDHIFQDHETFFQQSSGIAKHLYEETNHPNIKAGELYVVYFSNCRLDEDIVDAIGIFKSENKETFIKVYEQDEGLGLDHTDGININKLDKGCIVFNAEKEDGFRVCVIDNVKGTDEVAQYWQRNFLGILPREDNYYHTNTYMDICKGFVNDVFTPENEVPRTDQLLMMDRSLNFFKENDQFNMFDFESQVMENEEIIDAFRDYKEDFKKKNDVPVYEEFDISNNAVKSQKKFFKSVIKLDKRFHVYVHGGHDRMERSYDEEKRMYYYKLYFDQES